MHLVRDTTVDTAQFNVPRLHPLDFIDEYTTLLGKMTQCRTVALPGLARKGSKVGFKWDNRRDASQAQVI
jgi:hypothetical protein